VNELLEAVNATLTPHAAHIRAAITIQPRPFGVFIDYLQRMGDLSPMTDPFTFDMDNDELVCYSEDPAILVNGLIEMGMYMQGFSTLMGVEDSWKVQVAIGGWKHIRQAIKRKIGIPVSPDKEWTAVLHPEVASRYDDSTFSELITLAGCPDLDIIFPPETHPRVLQVYRQLANIIEVIGRGIEMSDYQEFNQRLLRAVALIEEKIAPTDQPLLPPGATLYE
jgi:hypothetical protein